MGRFVSWSSAEPTGSQPVLIVWSWTSLRLLCRRSHLEYPIQLKWDPWTLQKYVWWFVGFIFVQPLNRWNLILLSSLSKSLVGSIDQSCFRIDPSHLELQLKTPNLSSFKDNNPRKLGQYGRACTCMVDWQHCAIPAWNLLPFSTCSQAHEVLFKEFSTVQILLDCSTYCSSQKRTPCPSKGNTS